MDASSLRIMSFGDNVITGGNHAPTPSYSRPQPRPSPRHRAPAITSQVQRLQAQDLGPGPLVALARRRPGPLLAPSLPSSRPRPLRRDGTPGAAGHFARLRRP